MKRKEGESFEHYKSRRKADNILTKMRLAFKYVWFSTGTDENGDKASQSYIKSKDNLVNSRDGNAPDAPKRPAGDRMHKRKVNDVS
jgi:hypothetical protein